MVNFEWLRLVAKYESLVSLAKFKVPNWNAQNTAELDMQQDQLWFRGMP